MVEFKQEIQSVIVKLQFLQVKFELALVFS